MYRHVLSKSRQHLLSYPSPSILRYTEAAHRYPNRPENSISTSNHDKRHKQHYLIPQAYRRRTEPDKPSTYRRHKKRERRSPTTASNATWRRRRRGNVRKKDVIMNMNTLSDMESSLERKLNEYSTRLGGGADFGQMAKLSGEREERERENPAICFERDATYRNGGIPMAELYATEEMYASISLDYSTLITGLCGVADSLCNSRRMDNMKDSDGIQTNAGKEYESILVKAENYLDAYETFFRTRVEAVTMSRKMLEEENEMKDKPKMLQGVGSFLRGVFSNPLSSLNPEDEFHQSWQRADGLKTTRGVTEFGAITVSNFDELIRAHRNEDSRPDISLYEHILSVNNSAYCFGKQAKLNATERSNRLLTRWISLYCLQTKNKNDRSITIDVPSEQIHNSQCEAAYPEQRLFHLVMRQNADLWTKDGSQRVEEWLRRMQSLQEAGHTRCAPDIHAYDMVLLSYCNLCKTAGSSPKPQAGGSTKIGSSLDDTKERMLSRPTRIYILQGIEKVLLELNGSNEIDFHITSLNLALHAIAKAGKHEPDLCQQTDKLLSQILGEEKFKRLIDENKVQHLPFESNELEPDLDTYHWLINIYSASGNLFYIRRAMILLDKMIMMRITIDSSNKSDNEIMTPSTGTFNNALRALQCKVDELGRLTHLKGHELSVLSDQTQQELKTFSPIDIAKSISDGSESIVDAMVQFESSLPTRVTFLFMLQIWSRTRSQEAGDQAEELLSRMETISSYNPLTPFSNAYKLALQSWLTSAEAGRFGAVERAHRLLEIMEAQSKPPDYMAGPELAHVAIDVPTEQNEDNSDFSDVFDSTNHDYNKLYPIMLKICAVAKGKDDTSRAIDIAFETYEKMIDRGIKPRGKTFELMYCTVHNYTEHHPELSENEKKKLRDKVFAVAEENKVTRGELIGRWQQVQMRAGENDESTKTQYPK